MTNLYSDIKDLFGLRPTRSQQDYHRDRRSRNEKREEKRKPDRDRRRRSRSKGRRTRDRRYHSPTKQKSNDQRRRDDERYGIKASFPPKPQIRVNGKTGINNSYKSCYESKNGVIPQTMPSKIEKWMEDKTDNDGMYLAVSGSLIGKAMATGSGAHFVTHGTKRKSVQQSKRKRKRQQFNRKTPLEGKINIPPKMAVSNENQQRQQQGSSF